MKIQKIFYSVVNTVIRLFLVLIVAGLFLQSIFSTSFVGAITLEDGMLQERTLNIADVPWRHFMVFAVFTVLGIFLCRVYRRRASVAESAYCTGGIERDSLKVNGNSRRVCCILSVFVVLMGSFWILATQLQPGSDPAKVYAIAMQWREGNFSAYAEGGYLFRYPYQAGIILLYYLLSFVFGTGNYIVLQLVNVAALAAVYIFLVKLAVFFWKEDEKLPVIVYVALILWMPLAFYITYLYGILPGMALSLGAVYYAARYLDTRKYRCILPACICMGLATVIKMNCVIYLIAIGCFLAYDAVDAFILSGNKNCHKADAEVFDTESGEGVSLRGKNARRGIVSLAVIGLMGLSVMGCNEAVDRYVEHLSGYEAGEGQAMISWVVMGLQETPLGPGGYSGYIGDIYVKYNYDTEKVKEASWTDIRKAIKRMSENPLDEGVTFFARKNAFQWNDPTFISLDRTKRRGSGIKMPEFAASLIEGRGSVMFYVVMNYMQTLLLAGMLLYLIINWKSRYLYELMGAVVFLGGYLFHFIWESSASYTIPYFVIMIPYGAKGLADWIRYVDRLPAYMAEVRRGFMDKRNLVSKIGAPAGGAAAAFIFVVLLGRTNLFYKTIALNDGEEARAQFYHESEEADENIQDGYYYLTPCTAPDLIVAENDGNVTLVSFDAEKRGSGEVKGSVSVPDIKNIEEKILLHKESAENGATSGTSMRFRSNEQVLAVEKNGEETGLAVYLDDSMNMFYEQKGNISYLWRVYGNGENGYCIVIDNMALTCRDGEVVLEELTESEEQRWLLW